MGTRNLTCVMIDGKYKIAQYGQWDGYPSGQGITILDFIFDKRNVKLLRDALVKVRFFDLEGRDKEMLASYDKNSPEWFSDPDNRTEEQKRWFKTYISRDIGGDILEAVANSKDNEIIIKNSIGFAGDSLFCEYCYVVDLDKNTFEIFEGFNHDVVKNGRFVSGDKTLENTDGYEPVGLIKSYSLDELPSNNEFLVDTEPKDEEEE